MEEQQANKNQINIELPDGVAEGIYANLAVITHSNSEFVLDFVRMMPGMPKARVQSRIILTPEHAKRFFNALRENLNKFEAMHGKIKTSEDPKNPIMPTNFGGNTAQA